MVKILADLSEAFPSQPYIYFFSLYLFPSSAQIQCYLAFLELQIFLNIVFLCFVYFGNSRYRFFIFFHILIEFLMDCH